MDAATATLSSTACGLEHQYLTTTTTAATSVIVQNAVSTAFHDAGMTLMALIPLVGALGNVNAARLATDCGCMLGSFSRAVALGTARGALVQRIATPPTTASPSEAEAPFGLCLA